MTQPTTDTFAKSSPADTTPGPTGGTPSTGREAIAATARTLAARMIDDVEIELEAFVGNARMTVAELGALKPDAVVTLDAALNRAVELRLKGATVARGELVAVGGRFGVRLTEIAE